MSQVQCRWFHRYRPTYLVAGYMRIHRPQALQALVWTLVDLVSSLSLQVQSSSAGQISYRVFIITANIHCFQSFFLCVCLFWLLTSKQLSILFKSFALEHSGGTKHKTEERPLDHGWRKSLNNVNQNDAVKFTRSSFEREKEYASLKLFFSPL